MDQHLRVYACVHVADRNRPVLLVSRPDGDWCFLCGALHADDADEYRVVGIGHEFDADPTLEEVRDLDEDWEAERESVGGPWIRRPVPPE